MTILKIINSLSSTASNLAIGYCALKGLNSFNNWQKQKQLEMKSNIAEKTLNILDLFKNNFKKWVEASNSGQIFNLASKQHIKRINSFNKNDQKIFYEKYNKDPLEFDNYIKKGYLISKELCLIKDKITQLGNHLIIKKLEILQTVFKTLVENITYKHHHDMDTKTKDKAVKNIPNLLKQIEDQYKLIHDELINIRDLKQ